MSTKQRKIDQILVKVQLKSQSTKNIVKTIAFLKLCNEYQNKTVFPKVNKEVPVNLLTHYSYTRGDLENSLWLLKCIHTTILTNRVKLLNGVLSPSVHTGEFKIGVDNLILPSSYPYEEVIKSLDKTLVLRNNIQDQNKQIRLIFNKVRGLALADRPEYTFKLIGKRYELMKLLLKQGGLCRTSDLIKELTEDDSRDYSVKDAIQKIRKGCKEELHLNSDLIIGNQGRGYGIDFDKYYIQE